MRLWRTDHRLDGSGAWRGRLASVSERAAEYSALREQGIREALIVSTCNRLEIYGPEATPIPGLLRLEGAELWQHLLRVASGLESAVLGEPEIVCQLREAVDEARDAGMMRGALDLGVRAAFKAGKRVRTETMIARGVLSYAVLAVRLASEGVGGLSGRAALVVGAGEMAVALLRELRRVPGVRVTVVNRTVARAEELVAAGLADSAVGWGESVEAEVGFWAADTSERSFLARSPRWIDLSGKFPEASVTLDELIAQSERNRAGRLGAIGHAEAIVEQEVAELMAEFARREARR